MTKSISVIVITLLFLISPVAGDASYRIRLKSGGEFTTHRYWSEGNQIRFYIYGGIAGIHKDSITKIEKTISEDRRDKEVPDRQKVAEIPPGRDKPKDERTEGKVDITYYKEKKLELEAELKRALDRVREADRNNDSQARDKAREDAKRISAKMYDLTDELIKKNKGKMPEGWWEEE